MKVSTIREEFDEINDSMKVSSSRMKNKVGAQKGAFIKMKQENICIYQREYAMCYVPIIIPNSSQVYRNQLKARILRLLARILSPVINWTQPESSYSWGHKWGYSVLGPGICPQ
ncbi:hypothetical protein [Citrobacter sp. CK206]|uniref:hypothetical protein n=1 Tax=Citrobacter sp. CK206 TaxID=2985115 RepID=UPI00257504CA|nr:hypothetical protein [Citrobacter sp. CK206]MDM2954896.1 hypothetical protein [Citrobacter sp. CK206]